MGRKLRDEEFADPDFQALLVALGKVTKPVTVKVAERRRASISKDAQELPDREDGSITP